MSGVYSFAEVDIYLGAHLVSDLAEGTDVFAASRRTDICSDMMGADGDMSVNVSPDKSGEVTIKVKQTSPTNSYLEQVAQAYQAGGFIPVPVVMRDSSRQDLVTGISGYIKGLAPVTRGDGININEWTIVVKELYIKHGSASVFNF